MPLFFECGTALTTGRTGRARELHLLKPIAMYSKDYLHKVKGEKGANDSQGEKQEVEIPF